MRLLLPLSSRACEDVTLLLLLTPDSSTIPQPPSAELLPQLVFRCDISSFFLLLKLVLLRRATPSKNFKFGLWWPLLVDIVSASNAKSFFPLKAEISFLKNKLDTVCLVLLTYPVSSWLKPSDSSSYKVSSLALSWDISAFELGCLFVTRLISLSSFSLSYEKSLRR